MNRGKENPAISKATAVIRHRSEDGKLRYLAEVRENARRDEISALEGARKVGREEGRGEERAKIVDFLRKKGMSEDDIREYLESNS